MQIESDFTVPHPVDQVWNLLDVNTVALCLPGAELTGVVDHQTYEGRIDLRLGAVELTFTGTVKVTERDDESHRAVINISGRDEHGKSQVEVTVTAQLHPGEGGTTVKIVEVIELVGAVAEYRPEMVRDVISALMAQFASCVKSQLSKAA
jgi:carbon monoxide dehydrogenase subunit G